MKTPLFNRSNFLILIVVLFTLITISGCAPTLDLEACTTDKPMGFWYGLLHGGGMLFFFIVGLFKNDVAIYAANNVGFWYDLGYILGILCFGFGSGRSSKG